jgi:hypothetical protein
LFNVLVVISIDGNDCVSVLNLPMTDFEDAVVAICAGKDDIDYIVSNGKEFLQADTNIVQVVPPDDLLKLISP